MDATGWKIYFWIIATLMGLGYFFILMSEPTLTPRDILQLGGEILIMIGLYSYVFKKETFPQVFWKYFFWIWIVIDTIIAFIYRYTELRDNPVMQLLYKSSESFDASIFAYLFGLILYIPALYALYRLAYPLKKTKKK